MPKLKETPAQKIKKLEREFSDEKFKNKMLNTMIDISDQHIRSHKSYILKIEEIHAIKISSGSKYFAELKNEEVLPIGRTRYKHLKDRMFNENY